MKTSQISFLILLFSFALLASCGGNKENNEPSVIPDETSSFWSDGHRQHQLKGNVKTVETSEEGDSDYDLLEYDSKGNLIKDYSLERDDPAYYSGLTLSYDAQNRLTKVVYGSNNKPEKEVAEFGYDGSHTAYIPTNIYSLVDLRLQKGVSYVKYRIGDKEPLEVRCKSVAGNLLTFEGTAGALASLVGAIDRVEVECAGNYPGHIKFKNKGTMYSEATVAFGADGMPVKVTYAMEDDETVVTEFTTAGGFLLPTKQYDASTPNKYAEYRYNDKGYLVYSKGEDAGSPEYRYTYEYDKVGNWVKRTEERKGSADTDWAPNEVKTRKYTYWE